MCSQGRMQKEKQICLPQRRPWEPNAVTVPLPSSHTAFHQTATTTQTSQKKKQTTNKPTNWHSLKSPCLHIVSASRAKSALPTHNLPVSWACWLAFQSTTCPHKDMTISECSLPQPHWLFPSLSHAPQQGVRSMFHCCSFPCCLHFFFLLDPGKHPLNTAAVAASKMHLLTAASLA